MSTATRRISLLKPLQPIQCSVKICLQPQAKELILFGLPVSAGLQKKWVDILKVQLPVPTNFFVCSGHFEDKEFLPGSAYKSLKPGATPSDKYYVRQPNDNKSIAISVYTPPETEICRTCMTDCTSSSQSLSIPENQALFESFTGLAYVRSPHLPDVLCNTCFEQFIEFQVFKDRCETINDILMMKLEKKCSKAVKIEDEISHLQNEKKPEISVRSSISEVIPISSEEICSSESEDVDVGSVADYADVTNHQFSDDSSNGSSEYAQRKRNWRNYRDGEKNVKERARRDLINDNLIQLSHQIPALSMSSQSTRPSKRRILEEATKLCKGYNNDIATLNSLKKKQNQLQKRLYYLNKMNAKAALNMSVH